MYKHGDKRGRNVLIAVSTGIVASKVRYSRMGYWDDICRYEGSETFYKLERLRQDMPKEVYDRIKAAIIEDNAANGRAADNPVEAVK